MSNPRLLSPALYIAVLLGVALAAYAYTLRTRGIFACTAQGYQEIADSYLVLCDVGAYGDYDHGAFWFGLEPEAQQSARNAEVLFLGTSRMQFGFSSAATTRWFSSRQVSHYLLGFTHTENVTFVRPLLERLRPEARVYVINVDRFFEDKETDLGAQLMHDHDVAARYDAKKSWQPIHRALCTRLPRICAGVYAYYRERGSGHWISRGRSFGQPTPVAELQGTDPEQIQRSVDIARQFISSLPVDRACVVLTIVPYPATPIDSARAIAAALGLELVYPAANGLETFDGSHLDASSADRWSSAFLAAAGPRIEHCVAQASAAGHSGGAGEP